MAEAKVGNKLGGEMGLFEHLAELRQRLLISLSAVAGLAIVAYFLSPQILDFLNAPFHAAFPGEKLIGTGPAEAFLLKLKVAGFGGLVMAAPVLFHQAWLFVAPGLHEHEKKWVFPFIFATTALFFTGIFFGYYVIFPFAFSFFHAQYLSISITPEIRLSEQLTAMITGLLGFAILFQMPVVAFMLGRMGLITDKMLIDWTRYAIVGIFIVAAIFTPPEVVTQCLFAAPLLVLYGISILVVRYTQPKQPAASDDSEKKK